MRLDGQAGYVLHARPYRETSLLLDCYTRDHGRVGLVARGVRKERARFARALLQPLVPLVLAWTGRGELATLVDVEAAGAPHALAGRGLWCAMYVNELVLRLTARNDPHPDLYDLYATTLPTLGTAADAWQLRRFERDLLAGIGYGLLLDGIADSGEALEPKADYVYVPEHGPLPWAGQRNVLRLRGSALLALADDRPPADRADLAALRRLMRHVISHHLGGGSLRSWSLLEPPGGQAG